jgi:hypothetical protein
MREFEGAGCFFTNKQLVLAGYQQNKADPSISGIGGAKKPGELFQETAFRETLEELFHVETFPTGLLQAIEFSLTPESIVQNGTYLMIVFNFKDLETLLRICKYYRLKSPIYQQFPVTLKDLVFNRETDPGAEISHLTLIPMAKGVHVDKYFVQDIGLI